MFSGATKSGCGFAQAAMGPFYCPIDQKVYLDTSFFQDLERRFRGCDAGSKTCEFSQAYVIAHEIGHHVQNQLGVLPQVQEQQRGMDKAGANSLQVRVELQADCLAGIWANRAQEKWQFIEPGDVEAADDGPLRRSVTIDYNGNIPGLCRSGRVHPWHLGAAHALVHNRVEIRRCREL